MTGVFGELEKSLGISKQKIPEWAERAILTLEQRGKTQTQLASELGISREHVNAILQRAKKRESRA
jgi:DNA-binding transcriptional regulator LsrR (DeoR family)